MEIFREELTGALLQLAAFCLIPFLWWLIAGRKEGSFPAWLGLRRVEHPGKWWQTVLLTLLAVAVYGGLTSLIVAAYSGSITTAGSSLAGKGTAAIPAAVAYGFIRTGLSEEILFRGFLLKRIGARFGFVAGNTVQALIFGALHGVPFGLVTGNLWVTAVMTLLPGAFGWYQGWLNEKRCGGSILPSWLLHGLINTITTCLSL